MSEITTDEHGHKHITFPEAQVTVLNDGDTKVFIRNGIRIKTGEKVRWLVGELDGVRVYVQDSNIILTRQDLYP
jgi:hypothetical protein